ncbi:MAG: hypothetical protein J0H77_03660, partial [Alphaproteobacteria bacterium]|nr:hypothetical protein [Alphaproteobacteria bacterium]
MTNPFYNASGNPGDRAPGSSQTMRAEFVSIQQGFDKLPTSLSPNTVVVVNPGGTALTTTAYALALGGALTLAGAFTTTGPYATTLAQQANTTLTLPASNATLATLALAETLTNKTLTAPVLNTPTVNNGTFNSPVLVTPQLGTPASGNLANCTALPIATGVSGLAAGIATFLGAPSSANLLAAMTDETGTGPLVFGTSPTLNTPTLNSPTLVTPNLGTPSAGNLANCTNLPINGGTTGTLAVNRGGTGTGTTYGAGGVIFAGASGVYTADGALNWDNTNKSLGVGRTAGGSAWRLVASSQGTNNYPLVLTNNSSSVTGFYVQDAAAGFATFMNDASNALRVALTTSGTSYFTGGGLGINTTVPVAWLGVCGANGVLNDGNVFRAGSYGYTRYLRMGVLNVNNGGGTINQAPFIQSNYDNNDANFYTLHLNPIGGGISINSFREPAATVDVAGSIAVDHARYFYTPRDGSGVNTGTVRAGIQVDGVAQSLNFVTAGTYRGGVLANGAMYSGGALGVAVSPVVGWSSWLQVGGDVSLLSAYGSYMLNTYHDGTNWRRSAAGYTGMLRLDTGSGQLQIYGGSNGAAGSTYSPFVMGTFNLANGFFGVGIAPATIGDFAQSNPGNYASLRIGNTGTGHAEVVAYCGPVANAYVQMATIYNGGNPYTTIAQGAGITAPMYIQANGTFFTQIAGTNRLGISGVTFDIYGLPLNSNYTGTNRFNNVVVHGDGTNGYIYTNTSGFLHLGSNGALGAFAHSTGLFPETTRVNVLGNSGYIWAGLETVIARFYGNSSGTTTINAQAAAANNVVTLPPYNGTLLIGGTQLSANLGGDVALNNTSSYFNGPSIALPAGGTWFVTAG